MKRRLLAATAAIVLLAAGTFVLLNYVRGADTRGTDVITQGNVYGKSYA